MDIKKLTLVSSMQHSKEFWEGKIRQLERLQPGDIMILGNQHMKIVGEKDGSIEVEHPTYGGATVDPMMVSKVILG